MDEKVKEIAISSVKTAMYQYAALCVASGSAVEAQSIAEEAVKEIAEVL